MGSEFGTYLRELRLEARLSQLELAERANVSVQAISSLERGARRAPQRETLTSLIQGLQLDGARSDRLSAIAIATARRGARNGDGRANSAPFDPAAFFGRERESAAVAERLRSGACLTVWGMGGVGKTRLALTVASAVASRFPGGVWFVALDAVSNPSDVTRAVASTLRVRERVDRPVDEDIAAFLRDRQGLLVLDNAEHVIVECARLVDRILLGAPQTTVLATSREPLRIAGESVFSLDPLPVPGEADDEGALRDSPAIRMFLERATRAGAEPDATFETLSSVRSICRRLEGLPLAIELAAARASVMTPAAIARALDDRFLLLGRGYRTAADRHQTLLQTFAWSYGLASHDEQELLRAAAFFAGSWTLDDIVTLGTRPEEEPNSGRFRVLDALAGLVEKSLVVAGDPVRSSGSARTYRLLETTRIYAADLARARGEHLAFERRVAVHVLERLRVSSRARGDGEENLAGAPTIAAVRATLHWALTLGNDPRLGAAVSGTAQVIWDVLGLQAEGLQWTALALAAPGVAGTPEALEALICREESARYLLLHREAFAAAEAALETVDALGDPVRRGMVRLMWAQAAVYAGKADAASSMIDEATDLFESAGSDRTPFALHVRAVVEMETRRYREARDTLRRLRDASCVPGTRRYVEVSIDLGEAEFALGETRAAIASARGALHEARKLSGTQLLLIASQCLANYHLDAGDEPEGAAFARDALDLASARDFDAHVARALQSLALAAGRRGRSRDAALALGYVDAVLERESGHRTPTELAIQRRIVELAEADLGEPLVRSLREEGAELDVDRVRELIAE